MDHDPNQPPSSSNGQEPPPLSQQPPSQSELPQESPLYESPPQWGQQPLPQYRQSSDGQPQYGGLPIPTHWPPQPPKKRSSRWFWITLAVVGGLIAIFVTPSIDPFVRQARLLTCLPSDVPTTGSSIGSPAQQAGPVTTLNDNGPGSLRQIIANARPGSTITFDPRLHGTILLTSSDLNIAKCLTIRGPGAGILSISGGKSGYSIRVSKGFSVTISDLTFKDSNTANGFLDNEGTLMLTNSTVSGNTTSGNGGGISNSGWLTLTNSTVSGNSAESGGGIDNQGTLTLTNSTVSGNMVTGSDGSGGGISNEGGLTLTNSTVSGNTVTGSNCSGGGIDNQSTLTLTNSTISGNSAESGGGISNESSDIIHGTVTLTNSTISGNRAKSGGGIAISDVMPVGFHGTSVQVMLLYCTVYGNTANIGGGMRVAKFFIKESQVTMGASIIAGNIAHTGPDIAGRLTTLGYNLLGDRSGATFLGSPQVQSTDKLGVSLTALGIDPLLRDNGGSARPHTWTHRLLPGSPALDLIPPDVCMMFKVESDQRGVKRPQGKGCDSGAYEYIPSQ